MQDKVYITRNMGGRKNLELKNFRGFNHLKTGTFARTNILFGQSLQRKQRYMFFQIFVGKDKDLREPYQGFQSQLREHPALFLDAEYLEPLKEFLTNNISE